MVSCECGREFTGLNGLNRHKPYCKGIRRCQNPTCNKILKTLYQVKYCSSGCSTIVNQPGRKLSIETRNKISISNGGEGITSERILNKKCLNCGKPIYNKKYCNRDCQNQKKYKDDLEDWFKNPDSFNTPRYFMKKYLIEKHDNKCSRCGWNKKHPVTESIPLELHHKDGNWRNNNPNNLDLVCPNCHSLTITYRNNKASGREYHRKYYHNKKKRK